MDTQLQERVDKLEAEIKALRDMDVKFSRWNEARLDEIQKVNEKIDWLLTNEINVMGKIVKESEDRFAAIESGQKTHSEMLGEAWSRGTLQGDRLDKIEEGINNTHDRQAGLDAAATGYNAWRNKADNTFQKVTGRLGELQQQNDLRRKDITVLSRRIDELTTETERISDSATHRLSEVEKKQGDHSARLDERLNRHRERLDGIMNELANQVKVNVNFRDLFTEIEDRLQSAATEREMLEAKLTDFTDWCDKADYTLQRLTDRLSDVEEKVYENSFTPDVTAAKHPAHELERMRHYSREMYTVLELYEKASNNMHLNYADEAMKKVLRKVRGNEG